MSPSSASNASPPTRYLLIDNSNSRTKAAVATRDRIVGSIRRVPTPDIDESSLAELVADWEYDRVIVSSVVPEKEKLITDFFAADPASPGILTVTHELNLGIGIDFPDPSTIGADRLADAVAAAALYQVPAIVIDFGTAVTFDVLSAENTYAGGMIAPGLDVMTDYLHQRTALLPKLDLIEPPEVIGKSTVNAMLAGVIHGYRGLIKEILSEIIAELASESGVSIIATGGYATLIAAKIPAIQEINENLTLEGLRLIANLNPPPSM